MNNSVKILITALSLLMVALVYAYMNWPHQTHVTDVSSTAVSDKVLPEVGTAPHNGGISQGPLDMKQESPLVIRNIFAPIFTVAAKKPVPDMQERGSQSIAVIPAESLPTPRSAPVFMGRLYHKGRQKVFLSVAGNVYVVGLDDYFGPDNGYRVLDITPTSLILKYETDTESFEIDATEQPVSVLRSSGSANGERIEQVAPTELNVPAESGILDKEVPIDKVIDE